MIMILEKIETAVRASRKSLDLSVLEFEGRLTLANVSAKLAGRAWQDVYSESCEWLSILCFDEIGDQIEPIKASVEEKIKIHIELKTMIGAHHVFTREGFYALLLDERLDKYSVVKANFCKAEDEFQTLGVRFEKWKSEPRDEGFPSREKIVAARYVSSLHPQCMPPTTLENWILKEKDRDLKFRDGELFGLWKSVAIDNL